MTLESCFGSTLAGAFSGLAVFASVFLFVTGTFSFSGAGLAAARDEGCAFDAALSTGKAVALLAATVFPEGATALRAGFVTVLVFAAGFAIDLPEAALVAAVLVFFAAEVVEAACFAGFFIAFAMKSIPNDCSRAPSKCALVEPILMHGSAFARATLLDMTTSETWPKFPKTLNQKL